jgi:GAF domain-containing protein
MKAAQIPDDEIHRLDALHSLALLDTAPNSDFDSVVDLGRALFAVPICLVSLVDKERQWFKACSGLQARETPRGISFCAHAILGREVFVVPDAREDERFHDNPLVVGPPYIRFYAGAPLRLPSGYTIGTVCVISPEPRNSFSPDERSSLASLASLAMNAIALRAMRAELDRHRASGERAQAVLQVLNVPIALLDHEGRVQEANEAFGRMCATNPLGRAITEITPATAGILADAQSLGSASIPLAAGCSLQIMPDSQGFAVVGIPAVAEG